MTERRIDLIHALDEAWLKFPYAIMRDCGPAVQTLAGLLEITNRETFVNISRIASEAGVPLATCRKHLTKLHEGGWINNQGRQRTRSGFLRRTATISVTSKTRENLTPYGILPWWARRVLRPWSARALFSFLMSELCKVKSVAENEWENAYMAYDIVTEYGRFQFSLKRLEMTTGLSRHSIIRAKRVLAGKSIIRWSGNDFTPDKLAPNEQFLASIKPADEPGYCYIEFTRE